jgi:hypothetical protein
MHIYRAKKCGFLRLPSRGNSGNDNRVDQQAGGLYTSSSGVLERPWLQHAVEPLISREGHGHSMGGKALKSAMNFSCKKAKVGHLRLSWICRLRVERFGNAGRCAERGVRWQKVSWPAPRMKGSFFRVHVSEYREAEIFCLARSQSTPTWRPQDEIPPPYFCPPYFCSDYGKKMRTQINSSCVACRSLIFVD